MLCSMTNSNSVVLKEETQSCLEGGGGGGGFEENKIRDVGLWIRRYIT